MESGIPNLRSGGSPVVFLRGGGELATGIAHALHRAGARVVVIDRPRPTALRLGVAFATAALQGTITALSPSPMDVDVIWAGTDDGHRLAGLHAGHDRLDPALLPGRVDDVDILGTTQVPSPL